MTLLNKRTCSTALTVTRPASFFPPSRQSLEEGLRRASLSRESLNQSLTASSNQVSSLGRQALPNRLSWRWSPWTTMILIKRYMKQLLTLPGFLQLVARSKKPKNALNGKWPRTPSFQKFVLVIADKTSLRTRFPLAKKSERL